MKNLAKLIIVGSGLTTVGTGVLIGWFITAMAMGMTIGTALFLLVLVKSFSNTFG